MNRMLFLAAPAFQPWIYYVICSVLALLVLLGIFLMSKVKKSVLGNRISAVSMLLGIITTLVYNDILPVWMLYVAMAVGAVIGVFFTVKVKMIQMPQLVALLNGLGGASSAIVGAFSLFKLGNRFAIFTASLALVIGMITLLGSLVAAGKLHRVLPQKPIIIKGHKLFTVLFLLASVLLMALVTILGANIDNVSLIIVSCGLLLASSIFGVLFSIRVGGADMPITISLLNSFSGVAAAIAGLATEDILLVSIGGIVGASGLLLTQIMCKAMNRHLFDILLARSSNTKKVEPKPLDEAKVEQKEVQETEKDVIDVIKEAHSVIIVPGYGMAIAQAQHLVKKLQDYLVQNGKTVKYAIHPVAGRMPGHMNVLLCEANVDYEDLYEMQDVNDEFEKVDLTIVVGASDVLNPAARNAEGTPIYGMPILNVDKCKNVIIFNYDLKPGYAGVENPLYKRSSGVYLELGDAKDTISNILTRLTSSPKKEETSVDTKSEVSAIDVIKEARSVIIVPGYGMAIAQAQHLVKKLQDYLVQNGKTVKYAIHPVAGRMPGHMNVLLCEANVDYEDLYEMQDVNDEFEKVDLTIVVGASDVLNPAARNAEGTPIYGMPILNVDKCKNVIIFNYDLKPGYAGVENPLYKRSSGVYLELGDAKDTISKVLEELNK